MSLSQRQANWTFFCIGLSFLGSALHFWLIGDRIAAVAAALGGLLNIAFVIWRVRRRRRSNS